MTQVRILETCNFSYPLSIHSTSSRAIVSTTCCQVHPSIRLEETKSLARTSVYATSFRYRFIPSVHTRSYTIFWNRNIEFLRTFNFICGESKSMFYDIQKFMKKQRYVNTNAFRCNLTSRLTLVYCFEIANDLN